MHPAALLFYNTEIQTGEGQTINSLTDKNFWQCTRLFILMPHLVSGGDVFFKKAKNVGKATFLT